jgi:hypothetical protein
MTEHSSPTTTTTTTTTTTATATTTAAITTTTATTTTTTAATPPPPPPTTTTTAAAVSPHKALEVCLGADVLGPAHEALELGRVAAPVVLPLPQLRPAWCSIYDIIRY